VDHTPATKPREPVDQPAQRPASAEKHNVRLGHDLPILAHEAIRSLQCGKGIPPRRPGAHLDVVRVERKVAGLCEFRCDFWREIAHRIKARRQQPYDPPERMMRVPNAIAHGHRVTTNAQNNVSTIRHGR